MATALLIGTNAWANAVFNGLASQQGENTVEVTIGNITKYAADLQTAVNAVDSGETATIQLLATQKISKPVIIPQVATAETDKEKVANRPRQIITLDLNGKNIEPLGNYAGAAIMLFKGELNVIGSGQISRTGDNAGGNGNYTSAAIVVYGADGDKRSGYTDRSKQEWSTLTIGKDVTVSGEGKWVASGENRGAYGIAIQNFTAAQGKTYAGDHLGYYTYYADYAGKDKLWWSGKNSGAAFGVKIDIKGTVYGFYRGINVVGTINQAPEDVEDHKARISDVYPFYEHYYPYVKVEDGAMVYCSDKYNETEVLESGNGGIYGGGWCIYDIAGDVHGQTGVYLKAGDAVVTDKGHVYSSSDKNETNGNYHGNVAGNGIFISSASNYAGGTNVAIEGNAVVEGNGGAAIIDVLADNANGQSKVSDIEIKGGTIKGGDAGAIVLTPATAQGGKATVYDVNLEGNTNVETGTTNGLLDLLVKDENGDANAYVTTTKDEKGNTVLVITSGEGAAPDAVANNFDIDNFTLGDVNLSDAGLVNKNQVFDSESVSKLEIGTLMMNNTTDAVSLTIKAGHTIVAQKVIMSNKAQIIVEPGATLIVTGHSGINALTTSNIILQADATGQATFLFNPAVETNSNPAATVVMTASQIGKDGGEYYWHRFALPISNLTAANFSREPADADHATYIYTWDYSADDWASISAITDIAPFKGYTLSTEHEGLDNMVYTFKGNLVGNANSDLAFQRGGYHFFGNSYTGHIRLMKLVDQIMADNSIQGTVWVWDAQSQGYEAIPLQLLSENEAAYNDLKEIAPMSTFLLKHNQLGEHNTELNYASAIWGNPRYDGLRTISESAAAPAPARRMSSDNNASMRVIISAANGQRSAVRLVENSSMSDAFDNGYDASKFMNERTINAYVTVNDENLSTVATDNIEGKFVDFTSNNEVSYTLSFTNINGEEYAIRDHATGALVAIEEGSVYEFAAQPNSTIEGRFEIVGRYNAPTAIENTEVKANVKGIYTITGQFVGEDFNSLPAGVYVVDGVKVVK